MTATLIRNGAEIAIDGLAYTTVLSHVHKTAEPKTYFEIGTHSGDTLRLAQCRSLAVDPTFQIPTDKPVDPSRTTLREMTSDAYFAQHNPRKDLGAKIDLAFIDGMHEFPFLLRDFINTERFCARNGYIFMHDCVPLDAHMTRLSKDFLAKKPSNYPDFWTGDVWKMIPVLRKYRPDLELHCLDAPLTGLAVCRNLNPKSRVLRDNYAAILEDWRDVTLEAFGMAAYFEIAGIESASAWCETVTPLRPDRLAALGALIQPRRRLKRAMAAVGLGTI